MKYRKLHEPVEVGTIELKNRLVLPPMATEKSAKGKVTQELIDYYDEMSKGGYIGLVIQEHSYVSPEGQASPNQASAASDDNIAGLAKIAAAVHANGSRLIAQISHAGSSARKSITGLDVFSAGDVYNPLSAAGHERLPRPKPLMQGDIDRIISDFADAAVRFQKAGYDGVEIHSAHGYLLDQFYSPLTNKRTDEYTGRTIEGRTRLQRQIIQAVRERTGQDFIISLRLGASDYAEGGASAAEVPEAAGLLEAAGIDMLSITGGMCGYIRKDNQEPGWFAGLSEAAVNAVAIPVLLTGGITNGREAEQLLAENKADLIGIARAMMKDHELAEKIMA